MSVFINVILHQFWRATKSLTSPEITKTAQWPQVRGITLTGKPLLCFTFLLLSRASYFFIPSLRHKICNTVEPVLCGPSPWRNGFMGTDCFQAWLFLIDFCMTCYERPLFLGRGDGLSRLVPLHLFPSFKMLNIFNTSLLAFWFQVTGTQYSSLVGLYLGKFASMALTTKRREFMSHVGKLDIQCWLRISFVSLESSITNKIQNVWTLPKKRCQP